MLPDIVPVSGKWHTPGLPDTPGNGGLSVPAPTNEDVLPEASARTVTVTPSTFTEPLIVTVVTADWACEAGTSSRASGRRMSRLILTLNLFHLRSLGYFLSSRPSSALRRRPD